MIKHVHVIDCDSTQDLLKEQLNQTPSESILVSCENQNSGRGRGENIWKAMPGTLCFSINIKPHAVMSYTALELSVIVAKFFESKGRTLKLKWPNDLWDMNGKKCVGLLVQGTQNQLLAGIGINLFTNDENFGGVFTGPFEIEKKVWSRELADYIHDNRYSSTEELRKDWLSRCGHMNQMVRVTESGDVYEGIFQGLGEHGEALVCTDAQINHIYNGSLRLIS
jgi:BirA family transcriptional regulator, biotin operon repressor / biotin---[acetyl-CoA-carboxylase] ligase